MKYADVERVCLSWLGDRMELTAWKSGVCVISNDLLAARTLPQLAQYTPYRGGRGLRGGGPSAISLTPSVKGLTPLSPLFMSPSTRQWRHQGLSTAVSPSTAAWHRICGRHDCAQSSPHEYESLANRETILA
jgi:hypothetical protein